MDGKKLSFGFTKIEKKPNLLASSKPTKPVQKLELISCLDGKEIKPVEEQAIIAPLVIPLKNATQTSGAIQSFINRRAILLGEEVAPLSDLVDEPTNGHADNETIDQRAARELLAEVQADNNPTGDDEKLVLPIVKPDDLPLDGAKESNMDDYENVPIQQFGLAMLRGMGWVDPPASKKKDGPLVDEGPIVRPKGMGLGADKALKGKPLLVQPEPNEKLEIKRQAFVRILGGKHSGTYGQIEGFDDHAGRVIVRMAIGGNKETFNEFLCQPVSRKEFAEYGKCINTAKYEEYKLQENEFEKSQRTSEHTVKTEKEKSDVKNQRSKYKVKIEPKTEYLDEDYSRREETHHSEHKVMKERAAEDSKSRKKDEVKVELKTERRDEQKEKIHDRWYEPRSDFQKDIDRIQRRSRSRERHRDDYHYSLASSSRRKKHRSNRRSTTASSDYSDDPTNERCTRDSHKSSSAYKTHKSHKSKSSRRSSNSDSSSSHTRTKSERRHKSHKTKKSKKHRSRSRGRR